MALYATENEYCTNVDRYVGVAIQRINYEYQDMPEDRNIETFDYYFSRFPDDTFEKILSIQAVDSSCGVRIFEKNRTVDKIIQKNYAKNMDRIGACDELNSSYPTHLFKFTNNTIEFPRILRRNNINKMNISVTKNKINPALTTINADLNFTDGKTCLYNVKESDINSADPLLYTCTCT